MVCFRREGGDEANAALLERVNRTGEVFLSATKLDGRTVLRLAIGNARTTEADVRQAWEVLLREAGAGAGRRAGPLPDPVGAAVAPTPGEVPGPSPRSWPLRVYRAGASGQRQLRT